MENIHDYSLWQIKAFLWESEATGGPLSKVFELSRTAGGRIWPVFLVIPKYDVKRRQSIGEATIIQEIGRIK